MVIIGGMGNVWGVIARGDRLSWLNLRGLQHISTRFKRARAWTSAWTTKQFLIYGVLLAGMMLLRPEGFIPAARQSSADPRDAGHRGGDERTSTEVQERQDAGADRRQAAAPRRADTIRDRSFGGLVAVNDVTFVIPERAIVSLIGPNGAGKTTFFNILTGIYKPTRARSPSTGPDIRGASRTRSRRRGSPARSRTSGSSGR